MWKPHTALTSPRHPLLFLSFLCHPYILTIFLENFYSFLVSIIYKEELKTVVRELLACTRPNRHETFTALWNPYRRVSLRGRRAQIRFSRGARGEKPENDRPPFCFYGESIRTSVHGLHMLLWKCHHRNAIVRISVLLPGAIAVEARRRRAASARILYVCLQVHCARPRTPYTSPNVGHCGLAHWLLFGAPL